MKRELEQAAEGLVQWVAQAAEEARALDIVILEVGPFLPVCDHFVICHSRSPQHSEAICDKVKERLRERGHRPHHREGSPRGEWAILDYVGVVLHVFSEEARRFYDLERLWAEAPRLEFAGTPLGPGTEPPGGAA